MLVRDLEDSADLSQDSPGVLRMAKA